MSILRILKNFDAVIYLTGLNVVHYVVPGFLGQLGSSIESAGGNQLYR